MESYITSIHIKQLKCAIQHYWFQVYSCFFWIATTLIIHSWEIKEKQLKMMLTKDKMSYHNVFTTKTIIEEDDEDDEEDDDDYCFSEDEEEEEEEYSDDATIVTTTSSPWAKEKEYETQTLHSFDTSKSESKPNHFKRKMIYIKHHMTAWKQKHFHEKRHIFSKKKKQDILAAFRKKP